MAAPGIELTAGGLKDLEAAVDFLWGRSTSLADRFAAEYDAAVVAVRDFPESGSPLDENERHFRIGRGPYWLVYSIRPDGVVAILAVAHSSRRPGYWRERL